MTKEEIARAARRKCERRDSALMSHEHSAAAKVRQAPEANKIIVAGSRKEAVLQIHSHVGDVALYSRDKRRDGEDREAYVVSPQCGKQEARLDAPYLD